MNIIEKANMKLIENQMKKVKSSDEYSDNQSNSSKTTIENNKMNIYQKSAIILGVVVFIGGFVVSQSTVCEDYKTCEDTINSTLLFSVWLGGYLTCLLIYGIGEIIQQLRISNQSKYKEK